jgi:glycosyltransferase involved in cell wall biosynthesis
MRLSVVVPAFNEAGRIEELLQTVEGALAVLADECEVIVVDDGSTDGTGDLALGKATTLIRHNVNKGKAAAVQTALAKTTGRYVAVLDADLEYDPVDLLVLLDRVSGDASQSAEVAVYGSRYLEPTNLRRGVAGRLRVLKGQELSSWFANWVLTGLVLVLFGKLITDTLTGSKLYPGDFLRRQSLSSTGFEGDHEITAKLIRARIPITEVPIKYHARSRTEGKKIGPRDGVIAVLTFLRYRVR